MQPVQRIIHLFRQMLRRDRIALSLIFLSMLAAVPSSKVSLFDNIDSAHLPCLILPIIAG